MKKSLIIIWKLLGFIRCFLCNEIVHKLFTVKRKFTDDPNGYLGVYEERICPKCDYNLEKKGI